MKVQEQINNYISSLAEPQQSELKALHALTLQVNAKCKLWFYDGRNEENKVVTNPTIGYGLFTIKYKNGASKEWFQIGIAATKTGISIYILGLQDKNYIAQTFGPKLGKAKVTGYCIKFKSLKDINTSILKEAFRYGFEQH